MSFNFDNLKVSKKVKFLGQDLEIVKLNVSSVLEIQELAKSVSAEEKDGKTDDKASLNILVKFIKLGVPEFENLSEDDIFKFPMEDLSNLSNEISKYSGLGK